MKVSGHSQPPVGMQIEAALLKKSNDQMKSEGEAVVDMIDDAGINNPLSEGPIGRTINIGV